MPTLAALAAAARDESGGTRASREDPQLHSEAEQRLHSALVEAGLTVELKPLVDGYELDFAVMCSDGRQINIECDGVQHIDARGRQRRQDLARDQILQRCGWHVLRYPAWRCLTEPESVAKEIRRHAHRETA
ncbi:endonuclease domain-containing protein [Modestobacter marinus]|uniref:endonuclease domain-containing protein n=1 Tax=Modestobacter marinus TaxID=477641 RepID=UPI0027DEB663|nr:DUF559 domain-containing protein [Modestobacter marinus]